MSRNKSIASPVVYLGPDVPGRYHAGTTYTDGLPADLQAAAEACPAIKSLIVSVPEVARVRAMIERGEGAYPALMMQARKFLREANNGNV